MDCYYVFHTISLSALKVGVNFACFSLKQVSLANVFLSEALKNSPLQSQGPFYFL